MCRTTDRGMQRQTQTQTPTRRVTEVAGADALVRAAAAAAAAAAAVAAGSAQSAAAPAAVAAEAAPQMAMTAVRGLGGVVRCGIPWCGAVTWWRRRCVRRRWAR